MIKVLNIISDMNIGGAGRVIINYMKYADRSKFDVAVALPKGSALVGPLRELDTKLYEVEGIADKSLDLAAIGELKKVIREAEPEIVHTHGSMSGRIAGRQCGKTVIYTRHSAFPVSPRLKKGIGRWLNKTVNHHYADRIIAISPAAAENLTDGGISPDRIDVMMNGVEPVARLDRDACASCREKWSVAEDDFVLGILARIEEYKGHDDILDAVKELSDEGRKIKLLIAGEGNYEETVRSRVKALGIEDKVTFCGFIRDVAPFLSVLDVQLNASFGTETSSLSVLEGFSMRLPAIVSDYGGNPCLVDEGVNGLMFPTRNASALAECIRRVMDEEGLEEALSAGAEKIYRERFTGEIFAARIEEIYTKTMEAKSHG